MAKFKVQAAPLAARLQRQVCSIMKWSAMA